MNEQNSKKILFNKSTLWSLKAELLKKQEEVNEMKQLPQHKLENFKPAPTKPSDDEKDLKKDKKNFRDSLKAVEIEELEACRKAKAALEKKAELYEHLSDNAGNSQLAGHFLVDFNTKKQNSESRSTLNVEPDQDDEDDSDWTEFTDCLGRTRRCLKSDLEHYLGRDRDLMRGMNKDKPKQMSEETVQEPEDVKTEKPFLVQKTNDYLQSLREKWEQKEKELLAKDKDIHYQDLLFDEARMHGVGYYSFSTEETERRKQMEELIKQREETLKAQKETEELRKKRDDLLAARVAAARARQRARDGLPPEEPKDTQKDFTTCLLEFLTQQKNEADAEAKEKEKKIREEKEKERQKLRDAYVREWDIGKFGTEDKVKKFKEMSQEEYVEQQRAKRIDEFAPLQDTSFSNSNFSFDEQGSILSTNTDTTHPVPSKSWADVRPKIRTPPPPNIGDITEEKGLYFTTVKKSAANVKYRNFVRAQESIPIMNELNEEEFNGEKRKRNLDINHTEIAPPPTYDYYGPIPKHSRTENPFESDIREAYAQGAKSLESKASSRELPKQYDFTFN